jgi:hypothetical protein
MTIQLTLQHRREVKLNTRTFFIVHGAIALLYALGFLVIPRAVSHVYGVTAGPEAILAFRYFGVALLGVGLIFVFARNTNDHQARKSHSKRCGCGKLSRLARFNMGNNGWDHEHARWSVVAIYAVLVIGCVYFRG